MRLRRVGWIPLWRTLRGVKDRATAGVLRVSPECIQNTDAYAHFFYALTRQPTLDIGSGVHCDERITVTSHETSDRINK